jgi:hypothetical protein
VKTAAAAVALVVGVVAVGVVVAVGPGRHRASNSAAVPTGAPSSSFGSEAASVVPTPTPTAVPPASALPLATQTPVPSPAGPAPAAPADGVYFCDLGNGSGLCADRTGALVRQLPPSIGPNDISFDAVDGFAYYRQFLSDSHGDFEQIGRAPIAGGTAQVLVRGPSMINETDVSFGSPVVSPDGNFLAYGQMTLTMTLPSPGSGLTGSVMAGPNPPNRLVQIVVRSLRDLSASPVIVPANLIGSAIAAGPLLGWSADSRQVYLVGPNQTLQALSIGADGVATGISTIMQLATVAPGCTIARTVMSYPGDFYVVASCASAIDVFAVHEGKVQPYSSLDHTSGWQVSNVELDTTGHVIELDFFAPPGPPQCVEVDGSTRLIDGVPAALTLHTTPGCMSAG